MSQGLYKAIVDFFATHGIPYKDNLVGFGADGASTMFGKDNSVAARLKRDIPKLFMLKCVCHSLALAVSHASKVLPDSLLMLFPQVYNYLKRSSKRQDTLHRFQELLDLPDHKMLRFHKLRWLSSNAVVSRVLEQYDALFLYFDAESKNVKNKSIGEAQKIMNILRNHYAKLYLHFLAHILPLIVKRNKEFQAEAPKIYNLYPKMVSLFKTLTSLYLDDDYVDRTEPQLIAYTEALRNQDKDSASAKYWVPLRQLNLGPTVTAELACLPVTAASTIDEFRRTWRNFCIALATQISERFPFASPEIRMMEKLSFITDITKFKNIGDVSQTLGFDAEAVHVEYKLLRRMNFVNDTTRMSDEDEDETVSVRRFWKKVAQSKDFPILSDLVERISVLPHSSATVERIFSAINLNKTKVRNRLSVRTVSGLLHTKELESQEIHFSDFEQMIKMMNSDMYLPES